MILAGTSSVAQAAPNQVEWQRQYDAAQAKERSGKKKLLIGGGLLVGGAVVGMAQAGEGSTGGIIFGNMIMLGGAGTAAWGVMEWSSASSKMNQLEILRTQGKTTLAIPVGRNQTVALQVGRTDSVQYRVNW